MMSSFPTSAIIPVAVGIVMYYLNKQSKKDASVDADGNTLLLLPVFYGFLGIGVTGLGVGLLLFGLFNFDEDDIKPIVGLFLLFAGLGTPLILYRYVYKVIITPQGIVQRTISGKYKTLGWADIKFVKYNAISMEVKISDGITKIGCHAHLIGFEELIHTIELHIGKTRAEMGIPTL